MDAKTRGMLEKALDNEMEALSRDTLGQAIPHYSEGDDHDALVAGAEAYLVGYLSGHLDRIHESEDSETTPEDMSNIVTMIERRGNEIHRIVEN